jgi:hypothetical protein
MTKLPIACCTPTSPGGNEVTIGVKLLDSVIIEISNINIATAIYCYIRRTTKLTIT